LINGRAYKQNELLDSGKYRVLRVGNFFTNSNYYYSDLELENDKYCDNGDLLFAWSASFGAFIWNEDKVIYHYHIWKVLYDNDLLDIQYYRYLLNTMTAFFMKDVHGIGMVHLTKAGMEQYVLPLPPLALQQDFASKIESIEKQKELIAKSIRETETLFNSRMDYYFN
jgi:type I restriction enzyme S subunit